MFAPTELVWDGDVRRPCAAPARLARALWVCGRRNRRRARGLSHDNTTIGTNTETHTVALDAVPLSGLLLNATWYVYWPHAVAPGAQREHQHRLRLNATVTF